MGKLTGWTIDDEEEVFVPCPDYPDLFDIGSKGTLRSRRTGKVLSQTPDHKGYLRHASKIGGRNGKPICVRVHVQVAKAFVGRESDNLQVNHTTGDKSKNDYVSLEWCTGSQNLEHAHATGLIRNAKGTDHPLAALSSEDVATILSLKGKVSQRELGRRFGVNKSTIARVHNGIGYGEEDSD